MMLPHWMFCGCTSSRVAGGKVLAPPLPMIDANRKSFQANSTQSTRKAPTPGATSGRISRSAWTRLQPSHIAASSMA